MTTTKRKQSIPIVELQDKYENKRDVFEHYLYEDLTTFKFVEDLKQHARILKLHAKEYTDISYQLSQRLDKIASIEECQNIRTERNNYKKDTHEVLSNINTLLRQSGEESISCFDTASTRSGFSLSSQLRTTPTHDAALEETNKDLTTQEDAKSTSAGTVEAQQYMGKAGSLLNQSSFITIDNITQNVPNDKSSSNDYVVPSNPFFQNQFVKSTNNISNIQHDQSANILTKFDSMNVSDSIKNNNLETHSVPRTSFILKRYIDNAPYMNVLQDTEFNNPPISQYNHCEHILSPPKDYNSQPLESKLTRPASSSNPFNDKLLPGLTAPIPTTSSYLSNYPPPIMSAPQLVPSFVPSYNNQQVPKTFLTGTNDSNLINNPNLPLTLQYPSHRVTPPNPAPSPHDQYTQLQLMSNHLLEQELIKKSIEPFDGTPTKFWSWVGQLDSYIGPLNLNPMKTLQLISSYCIGEPQKMISRHLAAVQLVTEQDVTEVWENLSYRFGSSQGITRELLQKVRDFKAIQGQNLGDQLLDLYDLCKVILHNIPRCPDLFNMNLASGREELRRKLPERIQNEWRKVGQAHEDRNGGHHPGFNIFVDFVKRQSRLQSNQNYETIFTKPTPRNSIRTLQTAVNNDPPLPLPEANERTSQSPKKHCPIHNVSSHSLLHCFAFKKMPYPEKHRIMVEQRVCFRCLGAHRASNCDSDVECEECGQGHLTFLHRTPTSTRNTTLHDNQEDIPASNSVLCTKVCGSTQGINCSKTLLVEVTMDDAPGKKLNCYCILDEQSNTTLVDNRLVEYFGVDFPVQDYSINFVSENIELMASGQQVKGLKVRGINQTELVSLPVAPSCQNIANTSDEVASPALVRSHEHCKQFAKFFPEYNPHAEVLLLIGRNCGRAMMTECLTKKEPYVHRSPLGYSLVGNACPKTTSRYTPKKVFKTKITPQKSIEVKYMFPPKVRDQDFDVFEKTKEDDHPGQSKEDREFISIMSTETKVTDDGNIEMPLPMRDIVLPDNKQQVFARSHKTLSNLKLQPTKLDACIKSMDKSINAGYVEKASEVETDSLANWYLPIFCVSEEKKNKVRMVYDASARYKGVSLNDALYQGPDLNNQLRGVVYRFREKPIAFSADIEAMFNKFKVPNHQRDYLRFYWFSDNNPVNNIVPYRSTCHVFGCTSSPAVASYGLKYCVSEPLPAEYDGVKDYINNSFYVDDVGAMIFYLPYGI